MSIGRLPMSKRAIRMATALALTSALALVLLLTADTRATAITTDAATPAALAIPIPVQHTAQCSNAIAVPDPAANPGLVSDCATLLAARDTLAGEEGNLNWSADVAISDWDGIGIDNERVSVLVLPEYGLNGAIPPELGNLANLYALLIHDNRLTGAIPSELGSLARLNYLYLNNNRLTGAIPPELGNLANLEDLYLNNNRLTGAIPPELGNLANLRGLNLAENQLTGEIPSELGNIPYLYELRLHGNRLAGCIPESLSAPLGDSEIERIGLPICGAPIPILIPIAPQFTAQCLQRRRHPQPRRKPRPCIRLRRATRRAAHDRRERQPKLVAGYSH